MQPVVAIVGRPNVGKSRIFNRLARRRISIVHDHPGITRDIVSAEVDGYTLLDTGGFGLAPGDTPDQMVRAVDQQVLFAVQMAQIIVFVVDAQDGILPLDDEVGSRLRSSGKPVILVVNKIDHHSHDIALNEAYRLGLGEPAAFSAEHGTGEGELRELIAAQIATLPESEAVEGAENRLRFCILGRPNVGKSSLANRLLGSERMIVSDVPGTTREAVDLNFDHRTKSGEVWKFGLTDTAGLKKSTKLSSPVEYFSRLRSLGAIDRADVVLVVLDALDGVGTQDKAIAGEAVKARKPVIVIVNKWDLALEAFAAGKMTQYEKEAHFRKAFAEAVEQQLFFSPGSPIIFASALTGLAIESLLRAARNVNATLDARLPTGQLNRVLIKLADQQPPPRIEGHRFRIYYAVQTGNRPFRIRMFCNQERRLGETYRRYLEGGIVREFGLEGCPIHFDLVGKEPRGSAG